MFGKKKIKLHTYRYPVPKEKNMHSICIHFHGLYGYIGHHAHYAKALAESGTCVVGFDYRGYGLSEGSRSFI